MAKKKATEDTAVLDPKEPAYSMIPLDRIVVDPNQPRKFFDEESLEELAESIQQNGVLQAILVRYYVVHDQYMIVCGERRFKAAQYAGLIHIPAIIRELSDEKALEFQIVENLQREGVHPMEEATAFQSFQQHQLITVPEIAAKVGKSVFYVRQRLKLNELIPELQKLYFHNRLTSKDALTLSSLSKDAQEDILKKRIPDDGDVFHLEKWHTLEYRGNLSDAPFDTADATLYPKMGACIGCRFNSATANLFPDAEKDPICTNIQCYSHKCGLHFTRELERAKNEPGIIMLHPSGSNLDEDLNKDLQKSGVETMSAGWQGQCQIAEAPKMPRLDDYDIKDYDSEADRQEKFREDVQNYNEELDKFEKKINGGRYKKAFVVKGNDRGKYVYVTLNPKKKPTTAQEVKAKESAGKLTISDIDGEIRRIQDREKRAQELDSDKIWESIRELVSENEDNRKKVFRRDLDDTRTDNQALGRAISLKISHVRRDWIEEQFGEDYEDRQWKGEDLGCLFNILIIDALMVGGRWDDTEGSDDELAYKIIREVLPEEISAIETAQKAISDKRQERVNKRIQELEAKRTELEESKAKRASKSKKKK